MSAPAPGDAVRCRLMELPAGCWARLVRLDLDPGEACVLAALGLATGSRIVLRIAGDPCVVEVRSTRIGLARTVAARLLVEPLEGET